MNLHSAAYMQIQWIEMVYNSTDNTSDDKRKRDVGRRPSQRDVGPQGKLVRREGDSDAGCKVVCSIDEAEEAGTNKMLWNSTAPRVLAGGSVEGDLGSLVTWVMGVLVFVHYGLV
ncbi:hypothetical protein QQZ08_004948 [Neonectria magnoliae]|uniref:Uncharacterized protein n=1 Tax=Neonectria magnoliae TaxID=2732573 RepID=A0ABR1I690_9HYPO